MPEYPANRDPAIRAARRQHFLYWAYGLLGLVAAHALLPALAGLLRFDLEMAGVAMVMGLLWVIFPAFVFAVGMLMYAGALFEWRWFFASPELRKMRALCGDRGARGWYLYFGGFMMGGCCTVSVVGNLGLAYLLFSTLPRDWQKGAPRGQVQMRFANLEKQILDERRRLEEEARVAGPRIRDAEAAFHKWQATPGDSQLQRDSQRADESANESVSHYLLRRIQLDRMVGELEKLTTENRLQSQVLKDNQKLPPELVLDTDAVEKRLDAARAARYRDSQ